MKLRRAMAVAAATAVITPAAFLMAPAAYATDSTPSATESSAPAATPSQDAATSETTSPAEDEKSQETGTPEELSKTEEPKTEAPAAGATTPAPSGSASAPAPSTTPSGSASPSEPAMECEKFEDNEGLRTSLVGLPSKVVAGSGWQNFSFRVENKTGHDVEGVDAYLYADAIDGEDFDSMAQYLTVQAHIGGTWVNIADEDGYFGTSNALKENEFTEAQMRLKVDAKAPAGYGFAFASGVSFTQDGLCEFGEEMEYEFEILAAGTDAGDVDDAEGKPGKGDKKPDTKPQGELAELPVTGTLAETGSSSMLPTIGIAGGIAIVAGAGVVFALKRRQNGAAA
ncbi:MULTISPECIES: LPXTG cell wall anchor domain-containing protein [unclassified Streptomyces]|uniref:LPXTG cell wall anchor domain-containing protein n=1 Tax=unclassified Streptomyces TaxID=2593676 RepID=UPI0033181994